MSRARRTPRFHALKQALDEARFGASRTLNLRAQLPSVPQALKRTEAWLREKQMSRAGEVLIITGRGNQSPDGVSAVREAVFRLLAALRRSGVLSTITEHTPGSFVVRLAPITALRDAPRRRRRTPAPPPSDPAALQALTPGTRARLRRLAERALDELGVRYSERFLETEMLAQFSALVATLPVGPDREARLREALDAALLEYDDRLAD